MSDMEVQVSMMLDGTPEAVAQDKALLEVMGNAKRGHIPLVGLIPPGTIVRRQYEIVASEALARAELAEKETARIEEKHGQEMMLMKEQMAKMMRVQQEQASMIAALVSTPASITKLLARGLSQPPFHSNHQSSDSEETLAPDSFPAI